MPFKDPEKRKAYQAAYKKRRWAEDAEYREKLRENKRRCKRGNTETTRETRGRIRKQINEHKIQVGCCCCGFRQHAAALEFHHLDPKGKGFNVGSIISIACTVEEAWAEVAKCVVICANCHRMLHAGVITLP
jgi:hypothetical protein